MPHSFVSCHMHCVFSTKDRLKTIAPEFKDRLYQYVGGIARENGMKVVSIGGTDDHMHVLLSIPKTLPVSKAVQLIKGGSSKWVHDTFPDRRDFSWQEGYGAFSVSVSGIDDTVKYIQGQERHHAKKTFQEEFIAFLKKHDIEYDERYVWG